VSNLIDFKDLNTQIVSGLIVLFLVGLVTGFFKRLWAKINLKLNKRSKWPTIEKQFKRIRKQIRKERALEERNKSKK